MDRTSNRMRKTEKAGTDVAGAGTDSWQCNVFATTDGTLLTDGPWGMADPSAVPHDEWFNVRFVVDLEQDLFKMWIDGEEVFQAAYNGNFSSINFRSCLYSSSFS